jgi:choline dehydrogenase-like flavoprotein
MIVAGREHPGALRRRVDAVVVGTGAGGAMMARCLAAEGLEVLALEEGAHSTRADFNTREDEMFELLFQEGGGRATSDLEIRILQGRGVGGSTVHNTNLCKRTPPEVLAHWAEALGVSGCSPQDLDAAFRATEQELSVSAMGPDLLNRNNDLFRRGVDALGYQGAFLSHNRVGCQGSGYCELGCPYDAKQNALKVLVPRAVELGATVVSDARVDRVETRRGRVWAVTGSLLDAAGAHRAPLRVEAPIVCLAGSAIGSAALHLRSALPDPSGRAGRNLHIHPGGVVAGVFDDDVEGWSGIPQSYECTELLDLRPGAERRVWLVPVFAHPIGTAISIPGLGASHAALMRDYPRVAALTAMVHDESAGRVRVTPEGRVRIDYSLNAADRAQMALGLREGARILLAAGARQVLVPYETEPLLIRDPGELDQVTERGVPAHSLPLSAVHPMGTLAMGDDPRRAVVSSRGEHHAVEGLFVCDGSLFPTSIGAPPQLSIYSFARHLAPHVVEAWRRLR